MHSGRIPVKPFHELSLQRNQKWLGFGLFCADVHLSVPGRVEESRGRERGDGKEEETGPEGTGEERKKPTGGLSTAVA